MASARTAASPLEVGRPLSRALAYTAAALIAIIVIVPLVYVVVGGFRTTGQLADKPVGLPHPWVWSNYSGILTSGSFWRQVANSVVISVIATTLVVLTGALAAFPLSRYQFRGRESLYTLFTIGLLFPIAVAALPLYELLRNFGLLENLFGVALPEAAFGLPLTIVILRPFMRAIPADLEDAATVDGCSRFMFFWRILLPLSGPAVATVAIITFILSWNQFLLPLLVLTSDTNWTLPLGVTQFASQYSQDTAKILAFTGLSMLPALGFFILAERRIVGGLSGAVKG